MRNNFIDSNARAVRVAFVTVIAEAAMGASAAAGAWVQSYLAKRPALPAAQERAIAEQASRETAYVREHVNLLAPTMGDLQPQIIQLDTLSRRLTGVAGVPNPDPEVILTPNN